ncbi:MAG: SRPBCC family protein, partial [Planctomycetaceae bacterium]|nr:SRPBCC family protein [Planctomycetaceae bacterium]
AERNLLTEGHGPSEPTWSSPVQIVRSRNEYVLTAFVQLCADRETVFRFFSDAFQLERITPAWLQFQVLTPPPIQMAPGALIDYRLKLRGIPIRWRTEISEWDPPFSFVDRQIRGPYLLWEHRHIFEEIRTPQGEPATAMTDIVRYRVPGGALIHSLLVRRDVQRIFEYRCQQMQQIFAAPALPGAESTRGITGSGAAGSGEAMQR